MFKNTDIVDFTSVISACLFLKFPPKVFKDFKSKRSRYYDFFKNRRHGNVLMKFLFYYFL